MTPFFTKKPTKMLQVQISRLNLFINGIKKNIILINETKKAPLN